MTRSTLPKLGFPQLIKNELVYEASLERIYALMEMGAAPESKESDELELLSMLVERYEEEHYPLSPPHPLDAIKFRLDQLNLKPRDLQTVLGHRSKATEILRGEKKLTLPMIRKLHEDLQIPLESLIRKY